MAKQGQIQKKTQYGWRKSILDISQALPDLVQGLSDLSVGEHNEITKNVNDEQGEISS